MKRLLRENGELFIAIKIVDAGVQWFSLKNYVRFSMLLLIAA